MRTWSMGTVFFYILFHCLILILEVGNSRISRLLFWVVNHLFYKLTSACCLLFVVLKQNHKDVLVVVDSQDYPELLEFLKGNQNDQQFRRKLAWKAFQHVASYDAAVAEWLWKQTSEGIHILLFWLATNEPEQCKSWKESKYVYSYNSNELIINLFK